MMRLPKMDHIAPETVPEASSIQCENPEGARIIAGGTDVLVACKLRNIRPTLLVSLARIPERKGIQLYEKMFENGPVC
jgi:CO/xanthine dehydrogenase FAD-binding subunit